MCCVALFLWKWSCRRWFSFLAQASQVPNPGSATPGLVLFGNTMEFSCSLIPFFHLKTLCLLQVSQCPLLILYLESSLSPIFPVKHTPLGAFGKRFDELKNREVLAIDFMFYYCLRVCLLTGNGFSSSTMNPIGGFSHWLAFGGLHFFRHNVWGLGRAARLCGMQSLLWSSWFSL